MSRVTPSAKDKHTIATLILRRSEPGSRSEEPGSPVAMVDGIPVSVCDLSDSCAF